MSRKKGISKTACRFHCEECGYFTNEYEEWVEHNDSHNTESHHGVSA